MAICNKSLLDAALFVNDVIDEWEFAAVYEQTSKKSPEFQYWEYEKVETQLQNMTNDECKADFRVSQEDLPLLAEALTIPDHFVCPNRTVATGTELCLITSEVTDFIFDMHGYLLQDFNQPWLYPQRLQEYANAIHAAGAALDNCWGFVDGTVRPICRPGEHQRVVYNGHKRVHAIKFQSVVAPNGLVANLYGPIGRIFSFAFILTVLYLYFFLTHIYGIVLRYEYLQFMNVFHAVTSRRKKT